MIVVFAAVGIALEAGFEARLHFADGETFATCQQNLGDEHTFFQKCPLQHRTFKNMNNALHSLMYCSFALSAICSLGLQRASRQPAAAEDALSVRALPTLLLALAFVLGPLAALAALSEFFSSLSSGQMRSSRLVPLLDIFCRFLFSFLRRCLARLCAVT